MKVHDPVNSPLHYKREGVECIDAMKQTTSEEKDSQNTAALTHSNIYGEQTTNKTKNRIFKKQCGIYECL